MSAFGRVVALIGLIMIGFGLFTPVLCPNTGCIIPDHAYINTNNFDGELTAIIGRFPEALFIILVSLAIVVTMIGGHRFALFTASLMLLTMISMYLIRNVLQITEDGASGHLGWGWSLLMVGGILLLIAAIPKSDELLDEEGYADDYYDDQMPAYPQQQGPQWGTAPYQGHTMGGGWQQQMPPQQQPPPSQPQQPMLASGMMSGMYGTNQQPMQSAAMSAPQASQYQQRPRLPAQPPLDPLRQTEPDLMSQERSSSGSRQLLRSSVVPPDPMRQTEPDLLNQDRSRDESRQMARGTLSQPARPSVPSPRASQEQPARRPIADKEATNEFAATPQPIYKTPAMPDPQPKMTGVIHRPSPQSQPRAVDQSSQALIKTMISDDSKTIVPADLLPPDEPMGDATEPDRKVEREVVQPDPPPMPPVPSKSTSAVPAPSNVANNLDEDEVDLMRATGMIRSPKPPVDQEDVDLMRASGSIRRPAKQPSVEESAEMEHGKTTRAFGKGPPLAASDDRAAFLLNLMDDEDASDDEPDAAPVATPPQPDQPEAATQSFGKPAPPPSADRADFLLTAAPEEAQVDEHSTNYPVPIANADPYGDNDLNTLMPDIAEDDSIPFGVPVLDEEYEEVESHYQTDYPEPELEDSQPYDVPMLEDDDDDPEMDNDTDPDLRDEFEAYAAALTKEDTGPYDVPILEDDEDDDENNFQTIISPD